MAAKSTLASFISKLLRPKSQISSFPSMSRTNFFQKMEKVEEDDDQNTSIVRNCPKITKVDTPHPTASPPARGFDAFSDDEDSPSSTLSEFPVDSTGIVMLTVPSSCDEDSPQEVFLTPADGSLPFCSEEQNDPPVTSVSPSSGAGETMDTKGVVDLGTESDREDTEVIDDLGTESPDRGFAGLTQEIDSGPDDDDAGGIDIADPQSKSFSAGETIVLDDGCNVGTESGNSGVSRVEESSQMIDSGEEDPPESEASDDADEECAGQVTEEMPQRETGEVSLQMKSRNGLASSVTSKRVLEDVVGMLEKGLGGSEARDVVLMGCLEMLNTAAMKMDNGSGDDEDIFETAKKRGMTFPKPRWWPPQGFN